ncbi:MAG: ADP-ribose pyrophosphatase [Candidatus Nanosalina sp. J07AB43]|nr:MAG: ADP-ribose pyrophosphatase [Candidatus Nanosalina sp. J07AB43]
MNEDGVELYKCSNNHVNRRMIKNQGLEYYEQEGETVHRSVGIIVTCKNEVLLLDRRKYPTKHSIPAGHLEEGEDPSKAAIRELEEETGIDSFSDDISKVFRGKIKDACRRGSDFHDWSLYKLRVDEKPDLSSNDEAKGLVWKRESQLEDIDLTVPTKKFILEEEYGIK